MYACMRMYVDVLNWIGSFISSSSESLHNNLNNDNIFTYTIQHYINTSLHTQGTMENRMYTGFVIHIAKLICNNTDETFVHIVRFQVTAMSWLT